MMIYLPIVLYALIQGVTEFLPISSSGHLVIARDALQGLAVAGSEATNAEALILDIALHVGTLVAVIAYFWRDVWTMVLGFLDTVTLRFGPRARLLWMVALATVPVVIAGLVLKDFVTEEGRAVAVIGWTTLIFGLVLWWADRTEERVEIGAMTWTHAIVIGVAQAIALIPGVSRSGICMTAARGLSFDRTEAARFALLLSIPTIFAAGSLAGWDLVQSGNAHLTHEALLGGGLAAVTAYGTIWAMMRWLRSASFTPFVIYRIVLGVVLLAIAYL